MKKNLLFLFAHGSMLAVLLYYSCTAEDQFIDHATSDTITEASLLNQNNSKTTLISFAGNEGTFISLAQANEFTSNFQSVHPTATVGYFFGKDKLKQILDQTDCVGLRLYSGIQVLPDGKEKSNLVAYGVKANMTDIVDGLILEFSRPCPKYCNNADGELIFDGSEGTFISPTLAQSFINQFQTVHPSSTIAYFFGFQKLNALLNQTNSVGIRFYSGIMQEDNQVKSNLVLHGVDATGNDLANGLILEYSYPCPPFCTK